MGKLVVFKVSEGDWEVGFPVTLQIGAEGNRPSVELSGKLPPAPEIPKHYGEWREAFLDLLEEQRGLEKDAIQVMNDSEIIEGYRDRAQEASQILQQLLNAWLNSDPFRPIKDRMLLKLDSSESIRVIIQTDNLELRRLPWHLWDFFKLYPNAEVAVSVPEYDQLQKRATAKAKVRILAILGDNEGIDLDKDRKFLARLPETEIVFLVKPQRQDINDQLWEQDWDILFFAGHSRTKKKTGQIYINKNEKLAISDLKYGLGKAIQRGLKLAIFNSCDGLGLANELEELQIGQIIVMRERVPDKVAQEFLKYFLGAFAEGQSLYLAVRSARERLHDDGIEDEFPGATWLPVICQHPAEVPPTWEGLLKISETETEDRKFYRKPKILHKQLNIGTVLLASAAIASLVMGVRWLGGLQAWELQAFDQLMRLRPNETLDSRLLIVTIDDEDIKFQAQLGMKKQESLSDSALNIVLKKLESYQPQTIGLDIYRERPVEPNVRNLISYLQNERLIAICQVGSDNSPGILPPPEVLVKRLGFSDISKDPDRVVRRQIFGMSPASHCATDKSFSYQIAYHYLNAKGIKFKRISKDRFQIGSRVFQKSELRTGGYHNLNDGGYEVLLNYRAGDLIAEQVTLREIINGSIDSELPQLVKGRIVLIGVLSKIYYKDYHLTPYSAGYQPFKEMPGIFVQAHMVSNIVSSVLDNRPVLWWLPQWGDTIWVWIWSFMGGIAVWCFRSRLHQGLALTVAFSTLYAVCFIILWLQGGWMPLIPSALALLITSGFVLVYSEFKTQKQQ